MKHLATSSEVVAFWREAGPAKWFSKDDAFDQACRDGSSRPTRPPLEAISTSGS